VKRGVDGLRLTGPAPMHFRASAPLNIFDFLPSVDGIELSRQVLREWSGTLWDWLRGH